MMKNPIPASRAIAAPSTPSTTAVDLEFEELEEVVEVVAVVWVAVVDCPDSSLRAGFAFREVADIAAGAPTPASPNPSNPDRHSTAARWRKDGGRRFGQLDTRRA
jgi:hypothetical protein